MSIKISVIYIGVPVFPVYSGNSIEKIQKKIYVQVFNVSTRMCIINKMAEGFLESKIF